jgi:hypothetical protein
MQSLMMLNLSFIYRVAEGNKVVGPHNTDHVHAGFERVGDMVNNALSVDKVKRVTTKSSSDSRPCTGGSLPCSRSVGAS